MKRGDYDEQKLEDALQSQGLMSRFFLRRIGDRIDTSWKMYPLGILFGLGFDTATEIGLLAIAAGVATHHVPFLAIVSLPIIFAAGDEPDGHRRRRVHEPGLRLGLLEPDPQGLLQHHRHEPLGRRRADHRHDRAPPGAWPRSSRSTGGFWDFLDELDFGRIGYVVVGLFVATWAFSVVLWKARRIEERWGRMVEVEP